jgi:alkylation response protein AidB-like acyl-CoA dehydrogenase
MPRSDDDQLKLLHETVGAFADREVAARAAQIDAEDEFPHDLYGSIGEMGLLGAWVPDRFGGSGPDVRASLVIVERLARASGAVSLIFANCGDAVAPLLSAAEDIQERWLPGVATGEVIPVFALTEPDAGSDAAGVKTRAARDGDEWVINGNKIFITNGSVGDVFTIFARTDRDDGALSAFVAPRDATGLIVGKDEQMLGLRGAPATELRFEDLRVPASAMIGEEGSGLRIALSSLDESRLNASAMALGVGRGALEIAVAYARERKQFGQPIIEHQGLSFLLAEMVTKLRAGWAILQAAIETMEAAGEPSRATGVQAAMAKLFCTDAAMQVVTDAVQVLGGYGLAREFRVERMMRDAKAFQIFDGTSQIQKLIIGRYLARAHVPLPERF